jgi:REP element-mobilizing transposase RayT
VGGMIDHVHALISIPATLSVSKAMQLIKGGSSKWINDHLPTRSFEWQDSYGAFSIGVSQIGDTIRYITNQEQHHSKLSFADEFKSFLERHGMQEYED